jgi:hypothetical protein
MNGGVNCTLENGLTIQNISSFFFYFCETLPSDPLWISFKQFLAPLRIRGEDLK